MNRSGHRPERHTITIYFFISGWPQAGQQCRCVKVDLSDSPGQIHPLFPVYWDSESPSRSLFGLMPFYLDIENKKAMSRLKAVTPFYWSYTSQDKTYRTLFPMYSSGDNKQKQSSHVSVTPLFKHTTLSNGFTNRLFPIWFQRSVNGVKGLDYYNYVLPLYFRKESPTFKSMTIAPFYSSWHSKVKNDRNTMITPLYWDLRNETRHRNMLLPFYGYYREEGGLSRFNFLLWLYRMKSEGTRRTSSVFWPLINRTTDNDLSYFRFAPFIWYKNQDENGYFSIQPFFYSGRDEDFSTFNILWQVLNYKKYTDDYSSLGLLFRTFYLENHIDGDHEFRLLHKLIVHQNEDSLIEKSVFPFFKYYKKGSKEKKLSFVFNFYQFTKEYLPKSDEYYQEEKIFWFIRLRSNYHRLKSEGKIE